MSISAYKHLKKPKNSTSGLSDEILIAPVNWFEKIAGLTADGTLNTFNLIDGSHEFKAGKGFIRIQCLPFKNALQADPVGDAGSSIFELKLAVNIAGSYAHLHSTISSLKNLPFVVLVKDGNCKEGFYYQLGSNCQFTWMQAAFTTGEGKGSWKGYPVTFTFLSNVIPFYNGTIVDYPNVNILDFYLNENLELIAIGDADDLDALNMTSQVNGNMELIISAEQSVIDQYNFNLNEGDLTITTQ